MAPTLYIPEPIYSMAKNLRGSATKTLGVKPSGVSRDKLHRKELDAIYDTINEGVKAIRAYQRRGGRPTEAELSMVQDRLVAYKGLRRTIMERIQANRKNAVNGVYRQKNKILNSTFKHLTARSFAMHRVDNIIHQFETLFNTMKTQNIQRRLQNLRQGTIPSVPRRRRN